MSTLRKKYLEAVLKQDVGFFDTDARTGDIVFSVSTDTLLVQDAISEKVLLNLQSFSACVFFLFDMKKQYKIQVNMAFWVVDIHQKWAPHSIIAQKWRRLASNAYRAPRGIWCTLYA